MPKIPTIRAQAERPSVQLASILGRTVLSGGCARISAHEQAQREARARTLIAEAAALVGPAEAQRMLREAQRQEGRRGGKRRGTVPYPELRRVARLVLERDQGAPWWTSDYAASVFIARAIWPRLPNTRGDLQPGQSGVPTQTGTSSGSLARNLQRRIAAEREAAAEWVLAWSMLTIEAERAGPEMARQWRQVYAQHERKGRFPPIDLEVRVAGPALDRLIKNERAALEGTKPEAPA